MTHITPERYILSIKKTPVLLNALLRGVTQEQAASLTDGPGGWSVVETMCHVRDFGDVSLRRAHLILAEHEPLLPNMDPAASAQQRDYAHQHLAAEFAAYLDARRALLALLDGVSDDAWQRRGIHASFGPMTLLELLVFIEWHEVNHLEQIARTLALSDALM